MVWLFNLAVFGAFSFKETILSLLGAQNLLLTKEVITLLLMKTERGMFFHIER